MGLKQRMLKRQMIPFCFYIPSPSGDTLCNAPKVVKVMRSDGEVEVYDQPVKASEVMSRFPGHLVCRSESLFVGRKILPLTEGEKLRLGHRYFLLPSKFFEDDLSFIAFSKLLRPARPLEVRRSPEGYLQIYVPDEEAAPDRAVCGLCTTAQLKKDYSVLVGVSRPWKPKLETIRESSKEHKRKISYTSSFKFRTHKTHKTSSDDDGPKVPDTCKPDDAITSYNYVD